MTAAVSEMEIPLVFTVEEMVRATRGRAWTVADWSTAGSRVGRNSEPFLLLCIAHRLPPDVLAAAVSDAWSSAEFPRRCLTRGDWLDLFHRAGYTHDGQPAPRPADPIRLWRGATYKGRRGWSWTTRRSLAVDFAIFKMRGRDTGTVWTTLAPPASLLAYIHEDIGRGEAEYVVDTRGLKITEEKS